MMFWALFDQTNVEKFESTHQKFGITREVGKILFAIYLITAVLVGINMLIAMMNNSFEYVAVSQKCFTENVLTVANNLHRSRSIPSILNAFSPRIELIALNSTKFYAIRIDCGSSLSGEEVADTHIFVLTVRKINQFEKRLTMLNANILILSPKRTDFPILSKALFNRGLSFGKPCEGKKK